MTFLTCLAADVAGRVPALAEDSATNRATLIEGLMRTALEAECDRAQAMIERLPKRLYCFINGILTFPGDARNWTGRAVTWTNTKQSQVARLKSQVVVAEKVEYWAGPIDRVFGQQARAAKLYQTLRYYRGWEIVLVGHSNGADVIIDMLREYPDGPPIRALHLVCGATEGDFTKNGLNAALAQGRVGTVTVYCAGQDRALALAHSLPGKLLGYGTMGLTGPLNVAPGLAAHVRRVDWAGFGHSDCWGETQFEGTMRLFA